MAGGWRLHPAFSISAASARVFRVCSAVGKTPAKPGRGGRPEGGKSGKGAGPIGPAPLPPLSALYVGQQGPLLYDRSEFLQFPLCFRRFAGQWLMRAACQLSREWKSKRKHAIRKNHKLLAYRPLLL